MTTPNTLTTSKTNTLKRTSMLRNKNDNDK